MIASGCARLFGLDEQLARNPHELFEQLREQPGPYLDEDTGIYVVSTYADVVQVLRNPVEFSSAYAVGPQMGELLTKVSATLQPDELAQLVAPTELICADGERHARLRRLTNAAFTAKAAQRWEPTIRRVSRELIAASGESRTVEWVTAFASPLSNQTMAYVLGVPPADYPKFNAWSETVATLLARVDVTPELLAGYLAGATEFSDYCRRQIDRLRICPDQSLLSRIVDDNAEGDNSLGDDEIAKLCLVLLVAGVDTTRWLITNATLRIAQDPDLATALRRDSGAAIPSFIEEVLRHDTVVRSMFRTATRDTHIRQTPIPSGAHLLLLFASANRDRAVFTEPDTFDPKRPTAPGHLGFGHGVHRCLGAAIARIEACIAIEELLNHFDVIALERPPDQLRFRPHIITPALQELRLQLTASSSR